MGGIKLMSINYRFETIIRINVYRPNKAYFVIALTIGMFHHEKWICYNKVSLLNYKNCSHNGKSRLVRFG